MVMVNVKYRSKNNELQCMLHSPIYFTEVSSFEYITCLSPILSQGKFTFAK